MPLNRAFLGRSYPPTPAYEVGREAIRDFAVALGESAAACHDLEAARALGHPDLVAPPTFAILFVWRADEQVVRDPELGLDYSLVVHREQQLTHYRPIYSGDTLTVRVTVTDIKSVVGNELLVTRGEIVTVRGEPVCTATTMLVSREAGRPG
jgi:acyl dehydratase